MKILKIIGGYEIPVEDDEAQGIEASIANGEKVIKTRTGEVVFVHSIAGILNVPLRQTYKGYPVSKDGLYFYENGERILIASPKLVEYEPDPKYAEMFRSNQKLLHG